MGNPAGVKRDLEGLEHRRFRAYTLLKEGMSEAEVERWLGPNLNYEAAGDKVAG